MSRFTTALVAASLGLSSGVASAQEITIGHVTANLAYLYNAAVARGFEQKAEELGVRAVVLDPKSSSEAQANAITDLIAQQVNGIMINPVDAVIAMSWVDQAKDAGVPIIAASAQVGDPDTTPVSDVHENLTALIIPDDQTAGKNIATFAASLLPTDRPAKIAVAEGAPGVSSARQRSVGFQQGLEEAGADFQIVASQPTDWTPEEGEAVCQNMLTANPDLDLIMAHYDDIAVGCARAIAAAGSETILVSAAGGGQLGNQAIRAGELRASICTKPIEIGEMSAQLLYDVATGANTDKAQLVLIDSPVITKENLTEVCPNEW